MAIYDTPVDRLTTADLQELLDAGAVENVRLEFKREPPGPEETLKKLSSFANTYGGYLVVGAEAASGDGKLVALGGIDAQPNYKQTVIQRCAQGVTPLIQPFVSDAIPAPGAAGAAGKMCYVVYVPESEEAPHFLNNRKGAYVRTDEYSTRYDAKLATADELLHLFDRRRLAAERRERLLARAAARFARYAETDYLPKAPGPLRDRRLPGGVGATMQLTLVPRFPVAPLCEGARVLALARDLRIAWRQTGFPDTRDPITQHESALLPTNAGTDFSLVELNTWGLLSVAADVQPVLTPEGGWGPQGGGQVSGIHLYRLLGQVLVVLEYARAVYGALGFDGTLEVTSTLQRVRGVSVMDFPDNFPEAVGASRFDDEVRIDHTVSTERLRSERDAVGAELLRATLFALGWTGSGRGHDQRAIDERLLAGAYRYNMWPTSEG